MPLIRVYPVDIMRNFPPERLESLSKEEADRGEEDGLAGNRHYQDLRGISWDEVVAIVAHEADLIVRFDSARDLDEEAELFEEERLEAEFTAEDLFGLDIGVAGAAFALSALGAIPVSSCNAGGFGGIHVSRFPHVAFFIGAANPTDILSVATEAEVGLEVVDGGLGCLYGATDHDLHRFAEIAVQKSCSIPRT